MRYQILLRGGHVHEGVDERTTDELIEGIRTAIYDGLPSTWCWVAGLNVLRDQVIGVAEVSEEV